MDCGLINNSRIIPEQPLSLVCCPFRRMSWILVRWSPDLKIHIGLHTHTHTLTQAHTHTHTTHTHTRQPLSIVFCRFSLRSSTLFRGGADLKIHIEKIGLHTHTQHRHKHHTPTDTRAHTPTHTRQPLSLVFSVADPGKCPHSSSEENQKEKNLSVTEHWGVPEVNTRQPPPPKKPLQHLSFRHQRGILG